MTTTNTSASASANGPTRKTLASQLDRLDAILDALGEGLNGAVAGAVQEAVGAAVQEGVREGVRAALAEVLTNPDVLALLRAAAQPAEPPPPPAPKPAAPGRAWGWLGAKLGQARQACASALGQARQAASAAWGWTRPLHPSRGQLLAALGVATAVGVTAFYAGPYVAAAGGWLAGLVATLAAQAGLALRRLLKAATLAS